LASCGYLVLFLDGGRVRHIIIASIALGLVALIRPTDAAYVGLALGVSALCVRAPIRRRVLSAGALLVGATAGAAQWMIEAVVRFGGLAARMKAAQAQDGSGGQLYFSAPAQAEVLGGRILCAPPCREDVSIVYQLWWIALAVLVVLAVIGGARRKRLAVELIPTAAGLAMAAQYMFTVELAAPRYLIPAYALLSIPAASGVLYLLSVIRSRPWRIVAGVVLGCLFVAHTIIQIHVIESRVVPGYIVGNNRVLFETHKLKKLGVRPNCLILGQKGWNQNLAYALRCANTPRDEASIRRLLDEGVQVVWLRGSPPPPQYGPNWTRVTLPGLGSKRQIAYLSFKPSS